MPALVAAAITFGTALVTGGLTSAAVVSGLKAAAITAGLTLASQYLRRRAADTEDPTAIVRASVLPARWILGRARVGGMLAFYYEGDRLENYGPMTLNMAVVLSEGSLDAIERVWVDGVEAKIESRTPDHDGVHLNFEERWAGRIAVWEYFAADGTGGESLRRVSSLWSAQHKLAGKSWVHVRLIQNNYDKGDIEDRFWTHIPEINFQVRGLKLTWPGQTVPVWTESAAAIRYWWLTERCGVDAAQIDTASVLAAHRLCSERVQFTLPDAYSEAGYDGASSRYPINGVLLATDTPESTAAEFDFCWQGSVVEANARLYFRPGADRPVKGTLTQRDILRVEAVQVAPILQERINAVSMAIHQSSARDWQAQDLPLQHAVDEGGNFLRVTRDAGYELWEDLGTRRFVSDPLVGGAASRGGVAADAGALVLSVRGESGSGVGMAVPVAERVASGDGSGVVHRQRDVGDGQGGEPGLVGDVDDA